MRTVGVEGPDGSLVGAGALGRRRSGERYLLWLHAGEVAEMVEAVLWPLLRGVRRGDPIFAFWSATELSVGLEGLPRRHRPVTHEALLARGFTGEDRWLYLARRRAGRRPETPFRRRGPGSEVRVELEVGGSPVGGAELSLPAPGLGVIWWLEIEPEHRRQGLGRQLLRAARSVLAEEGVGTSCSSSTTTTRRPGTAARRWSSTWPRGSPSSTISGRTGGARARPSPAGAGPAEPPRRSAADVDDDPGRVVLGGDVERPLAGRRR